MGAFTIRDLVDLRTLTAGIALVLLSTALHSRMPRLPTERAGTNVFVVIRDSGERFDFDAHDESGRRILEPLLAESVRFTKGRVTTLPVSANLHSFFGATFTAPFRNLRAEFAAGQDPSLDTPAVVTWLRGESAFLSPYDGAPLHQVCFFANPKQYDLDRQSLLGTPVEPLLPLENWLAITGDGAERNVAIHFTPDDADPYRVLLELRARLEGIGRWDRALVSVVRLPTVSGTSGELHEDEIAMPLLVKFPNARRGGSESEFPIDPRLVGSDHGRETLEAALRNEAREQTRYVFCDDAKRDVRALIAGRWKLVAFGAGHVDGAATRLYDLSSREGETKNVAAERPEIVRALRKALVDPARSSLPHFIYK